MGDSRVKSAKWPGNQDYKLVVDSRSSAKLEPLCERANELATSRTVAIIIMGCHCDLAERPPLSNDRKGLVEAPLEAPIDHLVNVITTWDYQLRLKRGVAVVWVLPSLPNILRYNAKHVKQYQHELTWLQEERAITTEYRYGKAVKELAERLNDPDLDLCLVELERAFPKLLMRGGYDGIHYTRRELKMVTTRLVDVALNELPARMPLCELKKRTLKARKQRQNHVVRGKMRKIASHLVEERQTKAKAQEIAEYINSLPGPSS